MFYKNLLMCGVGVGFAVFCTAAPALGDDGVCDVGQYLDDNGRCKTCGDTAYYCPDGVQRVPCPEINLDYESLFDAEIISLKVDTYPSEGAGGVTDAIDDCLVNGYFRRREGEFLIQMRWQGDRYWNTMQLWYKAADGYYLSDYRATSWEKWYRGTKPCTNAPRNARYTGAGTPDEAIVGGARDYNDCPYECDAGEVCQTQCDAGVSYLKTSTGVSVKLWNEKLTPHSLAVRTTGGVCYANMDAGPKKGAINVSVDNMTYHVAD